MQLTCYAWRIVNGEWEAICTDLDVAAQGASLEDAKSELEAAVSEYVAYVRTLPEHEVRQFLNRKSPLRLRISLEMRYRLSLLTRFLNATPRFADPWVVETPVSSPIGNW